MRNKLSLFLIVLFGMLACQEPTKKVESNPVQSTTIEADSSLLQSILASETKGLRGISIGDSITEVMRTEKAVLSEDSVDYKGFTQNFSDTSTDEFADILYKTDENGKVKNITIDVFLNEQAQTDKLIIECRDYYIKKYGNPIEKKLELVWKMPDGAELSLKDVSIKQAPGMQLRLRKR